MNKILILIALVILIAGCTLNIRGGSNEQQSNNTSADTGEEVFNNVESGLLNESNDVNIGSII